MRPLTRTGSSARAFLKSLHKRGPGGSQPPEYWVDNRLGLGDTRAAHVGGNLNNGSNDGPWNWNLNNAASNTNWNIGARQLIDGQTIFSCVSKS